MQVRILLAFIFISVFTFGAGAQTEIDSSDSENVSIIRYHLDGSSPKINDIEIDNNNRVLVATDKMLLTIGNTNERPLIFLENTYLRCVTFDKKGNIYAAGGNHIYLVSDGKKKTIDNPDAKIKDIAFTPGKLWLATNQGLYVYLISSGNWKLYDTSNSKLKSNNINFAQTNDDGVLWVGTSKGYLKIDGDKWELEDKKYDVLSTRSNKEGQWMVADGDMWLIDPFNRKYDVGLDRSLYKGDINDFVIDSKGRLYMASELLVRYNPYKEETEQYGEDVGLLSQKCLTLACDKNNNIWIGTADAGLFRILFDDIAQEQINATILVENAISCNDKEDAILKVSVSGGVKPYKYTWSKSTVKGANPSGLGAGSYAVTVTDKFGSQYVTEVSLTEPSPLTVELLETKRLSGFGRKDGSAKVTAKGGTGNLKYVWSDGDKGPELTKAKAGIYTVTVTDEEGCRSTLDVEIKKEKYIPELEITKVGIGQTLRINELNFDADSTKLKAENYEILDEVYEFLIVHNTVVIEIGGHTNTIPPHSYCDKLSTARARSVAEYIVAKGIDVERVSYKGYGKREPITKSESSSARKKNQRVEVKILSM